MKKNKFIKSTIILIIGGLISKILGMITKIINTKIIGTEGLSLYMLIMPTFLFFINLSQLGFPLAVSNLVAKEKSKSKKIILTTIRMSLMVTSILIITIFLLSPIISNLLKEQRTYYPLISIGLTLPFISISGIIRGYFFGKERMLPNTLSNVSEQIIRLILIMIITPLLLQKGLVTAIVGTILYNIISETLSIIILFFFLPKKTKILHSDLKFDQEIAKDVLNISLPTTGSRLIGSFIYFLEPIILTFVLTKVGYNTSFILKEYGIITGYVFPLLMIPSFFSLSISSALVPVISRAYSNNNKNYIKKKIRQALTISLSIGLLSTIIFMFQTEKIMKLIYNTNLGIQYTKILAPLFLIYYIQTPITAALQSMNMAKDTMNSTIISGIIKITLLFALSWLKIGMISLIIATVINIFTVTIYNYYKLQKKLHS